MTLVEYLAPKEKVQLCSIQAREVPMAALGCKYEGEFSAFQNLGAYPSRF